MNPTLTINCRTIGKRTRRRFRGPTPEQYTRAIELDLQDRLFNYGVKKAGTVIAVELLNTVLERRNNTADHFRIMYESFRFLLEETAPMIRQYADRLIFKVPGGNPAPWPHLSLRTIHSMVYPWEAVLDEGDALILDGMADEDNFRRVRVAIDDAFPLGTSVLPGWREASYPRDHPAGLRFTSVRNLQSIARRVGQFWDWHGKWEGPGGETFVVMTGHGRHERDGLNYYHRALSATPTVMNGNDEDHRAVAAWMEEQV